ncbi:hypothetical protein HFN92_35315 [Rhizobium laguerreae]|nr:hypothetical protein [Rhizobium laguerreae]
MNDITGHANRAAGSSVGRRTSMALLRVVLPVFASLSTAATLGACSAGTTARMPGGHCDAAAARTLVGNPRPTDGDAKHRTGATTVRQIAPGQPVTHDYREGRVTVETDPASGRVVGATCG